MLIIMTNSVKKQASAMTEVTNARKRVIKTLRHDLFKSFHSIKTSNKRILTFFFSSNNSKLSLHAKHSQACCESELFKLLSYQLISYI